MLEEVTEVRTTELGLPSFVSTSKWFEGSELGDSSCARAP